MEVLFIILPLAIVMAGIAAAAFYWGVQGGQFDDLETPRFRALFDDPGVINKPSDPAAVQPKA